MRRAGHALQDTASGCITTAPLTDALPPNLVRWPESNEIPSTGVKWWSLGLRLLTFGATGLGLRLF